MTVLSDKWIKEMVKAKGMIKPFVSKQKRKGKISFGLSSYGYDARVSDDFKVFTNVNSAIVDPKNFKKESFISRKSKICVIPPNSFALAITVEYFKIPENVMDFKWRNGRILFRDRALKREFHSFPGIPVRDLFAFPIPSSQHTVCFN